MKIRCEKCGKEIPLGEEFYMSFYSVKDKREWIIPLCRKCATGIPPWRETLKRIFRS